MTRLRVLVFALFVAQAAEKVATTPPAQTDPFVGTWQQEREKKAGYVRMIARDGEELVFSSRGEAPKPHEHNYRIFFSACAEPDPG
jgi:hypothetical protein